MTAALVNATEHHVVTEKIEETTNTAREQVEVAQARADSMDAELQQARQQNKDMEAYIEDLQHQIEVANQVVQDSGLVEEQTAQLQRRLDETQSELDITRNASQVELAALRARVTAAVIGQQELTLLQEQLMAKARETIRLQTRMAEAEVVADVLREQVASGGSQQGIQHLEKQIDGQKSIINQLKTELAETQASSGMEFASLQQQVQVEAADRAALANLQAALADRNALVEALEEQLSVKARALVDVKSNVGNVDDSLRALQQQLTVKNDELLALQDNLANVRAEASAQIRKLGEQLETQSSNADQSSAYQAVVARLEAELGEKAVAIDGLEAQLTETTALLNAIESQLANAAAAVEVATSKSGEIEGHNEVIASIAQELRSPMTSIVGYTDLLLNESMGIIGALQRKILQRVQSSTERMFSLLDNLVSITALDSGQFELEPERVDVTVVLEEAIGGAKSQFQDKNLTLRMDIGHDLPHITADRDAVLQIATHLISNAILASAVESEVSLIANHVDASIPGPGDTERQTACIQLSVTDSGDGIKPEDQQRVFLRKYRADNPLIDGLGDTGVALSISKALVDAHGGYIWLESEVGLGTTFNVLLPVEGVREDMAQAVPAE